MVKNVSLAVILLGAGLVIGWVAGPTLRHAPEPDSGPDAIPIEIVAPNAELDRLRAERDRLEAENDDLVEQVTSLLDEQAEWLSAADVSAPVESNAALAEPDEERRPRRLDWDSEEMRARREEFMRQNAERMQEFEDRLAEQLADPAALERFNALMEWREYQRELMGEMRRAETDEERNAIRAKMEETRNTSRRMVNDQQDAMLRDLAVASGITDPREQKEFITSLRNTLDNPFFSMEGMLVGGGPPGRGFGRGPRGRRQ